MWSRNINISVLKECFAVVIAYLFSRRGRENNNLTKDLHISTEGEENSNMA